MEMQSADSDALLLALSIPILLTSLLGSAIEINTVAELGRRESPGGSGLGGDIWKRYTLKILAFSVIVTAVLIPLLSAVYLNTYDSSAFLTPLIAVALCPIAAAWSSIASGEAIHLSHTAKAILMQSFRSVPPIILILLDAPIAWVAAGFLIGELIRGTYLRHVNGRKSIVKTRTPSNSGVLFTASDLSVRSIPWQTMSSGVGQVGPVVGRGFVSSGQEGSVSAYEIADKIIFAAAQFLNLGLLLRRIGEWSRYPTMDRADVVPRFRRDVWVLVVACVGFSVSGAAICLVGRQLTFIPYSWHLGLYWGAIQCAGVLPQIVSVAASRLLIIGGASRALLPLAATNVSVTVTLFCLFYFWLGPVGIIVAAVVARWALVPAYWFAVHRVKQGIFGVDGAVEDGKARIGGSL